jgi:hypothetical protein
MYVCMRVCEYVCVYVCMYVLKPPPCILFILFCVLNPLPLYCTCVLNPPLLYLILLRRTLALRQTFAFGAWLVTTGRYVCVYVCVYVCLCSQSITQ